MSVRHGGQLSFTMSRLNLKLNIFGEVLVSQMGGQSSFTMSRLNLNLKFFGEVLVSQSGRSIIFHHVQDKSEIKNFRLGPGQSVRVVHHLSPCLGQI